MKSLIVLVALATSLGFGQNKDCNTIQKCEELLKKNPSNSLAHYRVGELLFEQKEFQPAALAFDDSLKGDLEPKWTGVWAHINLGKIFDLTRQRDRAINEYRLAQRTKDDTRGAQAEAAKYLASPYTGE